jgi:hypothetical protein
MIKILGLSQNLGSFFFMANNHHLHQHPSNPAKSQKKPVSTTQKMKPAMSSLTTDNPVPPTFTLFRHLPAELQDEVWTHAAATPRLQYLLQNERNRVSHLRPSMFPHPESGIRAQSALSSVCHAAQAAVGRYTKTARDKATIADVIGYTPRRKFCSFDLDLQNDLVCFGPPDAD